MKRQILSAMAFIALLAISAGAQEVIKGQWLGRFENNKFWIQIKSSTSQDNSMFSSTFDLELDKVAGLKSAGVNIVSRVRHVFPENEHNRAYFKAKAEKAGHLF